MAIELATGYVSLVPSARGFKGAIEKEFSGIGAGAGATFSKGFVGKLTSGIMQPLDNLGGEIVDRIGSAAAKAAKVGLVAVGAGIGLSLWGGLRRVLDTEDASILLRQMGLSIREIDQALKGVDRTFLGTPFANPQGFNITAQLVASGRGLNQVETDLRNIANVTSQTLDKDLSRTSESFLKIAATGRAYAVDLNSLALQGIPIRQILAAGLNVTVDELNNMVTEGEVTFDTIMDIVGATERFDGAAQAMGSSTRGAFQNVLTGVARLGQSFLGPLFGENGHAVSALQSIRAALFSLAPVADRLGQRFAAWLVPAVASVSSAFRSVVAFVQRNRDTIVDLAKVIIPATAAVGGLAVAVNLTRRALILLKVITPLGLMVAFASGLIYAYQNSERFRDVVHRIADVLRDVLAGTLSFVTGLWSAHGDTVVAMAAAVGLAVLTMVEKFTSATEFVVRNWSTIRPILLAVGAVIVTVLIPHWAALGLAAVASSLKQVGAWVATQVAAAKAAVIHSAQVAVMVGKWVLLGVQSLIHAAKVAAAWMIAMGPIAIVVAAVVGLTVAVVKNWDTIRNAITTAATAVLSFLRANWPMILAIVTGPIGLAVLAVVRHWDTIRDTASAALRAVIGFFRDLPGNIIEAVGDIASKMSELGRKIVGGIIDGIQSAAGGIASAITNAIPGGGAARGIGGFIGRQLDRYDFGGVVPGPRGAPTLALLHGGETILPTHQYGSAAMPPTRAEVEFPDPVEWGRVAARAYARTLRLERKTA